jgi:hypothetical protein
MNGRSHLCHLALRELRIHRQAEHFFGGALGYWQQDLLEIVTISRLQVDWHGVVHQSTYSLASKELPQFVSLT